MKAVPRPATPQTNPSRAAPVALGFFALGFFSFVTALGALLAVPDLALGDPRRPAVVALAHLVVLGWTGSLLFGGGYLVLPVLSTVRLWSVKLAGVHLLLHAIGLPWMIAHFFLMDFDRVGHGGTLIFLGMVLFVVNLAVTSHRTNRWDPANLTVYTALFWLLIAGGLAVFLLVNRALGLFAIEHEWVMALHAHFGLVGFLWMLIIGAGLKAVPMFLVSSRQPGFFSWCGYLVFNAGLLLLIPLELYERSSFRGFVVLLIGLASVLYGIDFIRILLSRKQRLDTGLIAAATGLVTVFLLFGWVLAGRPMWPGAGEIIIGEQVRIYFIISLFGSFSLILFGMGMRVVPFMVWQMYYAPRVGNPNLPSSRDLIVPGGAQAVFVSLLLGWGYLAAGQLTNEIVGVQLATMLLLIGAGWFIYTVHPALGTLLGAPVTIGDSIPTERASLDVSQDG